MIGIYGRKSLYVKDSISIEMQLDKCRQLCDPTDDIKEYKDEGYSGKNIKRPAFIELMEAVKNGLLHKVIVYKIDRFSRSIMDFSTTWSIMSEHNVEFVSVNEKFDTTSPIGKAMLFIIMVFAQLERETTAERVKDNYYTRAELGSWMGGPAPYGFTVSRLDQSTNSYDLVKADHRSKIPTLQANEKIEIIKEIFVKYIEPTISLGMIAKILNEREIPGPKRKTWNNVSLARLFRNPCFVKADAKIYAYYKSLNVNITNDIQDFQGDFAGMIVGKRGATNRKRKELSEATFSIANWYGVIDSDIWLTVQEKLLTNEQLGSNFKGKHTWLSGLIKCGYCKRALTIMIDNKYGYRRLRCSGRNDHICDQVSIIFAIEEIEEEVQFQIEELFQKCAEEPIEELVQVSNQDKIELQVIENKIENLMNCISGGNATDITITYINKELALLSKKQEELAKLVYRPVHKKKLEKINFNNLDLEDKKIVAVGLIDKVYVYDYNIEIVWHI